MDTKIIKMKRELIDDFKKMYPNASYSTILELKMRLDGLDDNDIELLFSCLEKQEVENARY